jgi:hypothetical protein
MLFMYTGELIGQEMSAKNGTAEYGQPHVASSLVDARIPWPYDWQASSDVPNPSAVHPIHFDDLGREEPKYRRRSRRKEIGRRDTAQL